MKSITMPTKMAPVKLVGQTPTGGKGTRPISSCAYKRFNNSAEYLGECYAYCPNALLETHGTFLDLCFEPIGMMMMRRMRRRRRVRAGDAVQRGGCFGGMGIHQLGNVKY